MIEVRKEVLDAFRMMWGLHPSPVMLIHKSREIVAANTAAEKLGLPTGILCHSLYPSDKPCPGCLANVALKKNEGIRRGAYSEKMQCFMDGFWIPVTGEDDLYVHYGNDITEFVKPELLPAE